MVTIFGRKPLLLSLSLLVLLAVGVLASCGSEVATATTTTALPTTTTVASTSTPTDSQQEMQAVLDAYTNDVGALGQKMVAAENAASAVLKSPNMPAATQENMAAASQAASTAAAAWQEWKDRKPALSILEPVHQQLLTYLDNMSQALAHLEQGVRNQDLSEFKQFGQLVRVAYIAKKTAWDTLLSLGTIEKK